MRNAKGMSRRRFLELSGGALLSLLPSACVTKTGSEPTGAPTPAATSTALPPTLAGAAPTELPMLPVSLGKVPVTLANTEVFDLASAIVGRSYRIYVALPRGYGDSSTAYPVLFAGDANASFGMVTEIARGLADAGELPDLLIVGIGYPTDSRDEIMNRRTGDFTPTYYNAGVGIPGELSFPSSGRAGGFLRFIREELVPVIHTDYRTIPQDSAFLGHSFGGLFSLYTLFTFPDTFDRYIIASPSIWWDGRVILRFEEKYASEHTDLAARVYMAVGTLEGSSTVKDVLDLAEALEGRAYPGLSLTTHVFEDETHISVLAGTISKGLRSIYGSAADD